METRDLQVLIKGDASDFKRAMNDVDNHSSKLNKGFDNLKTGALGFVAGLTAVGVAATAFGVASVDAYNASVEASTKLATNLLNVKGNTQANVDELDNLAKHLQKVGVIEDDVVKAGMSQLATFNLQGSTIATLTPKIADMVAQLKGHNATAEDMVTINNLVGKVMTGNVGALSKYGVTLSENQKELLQQGNETQRAAVLNEVLAQNYGKVNEALRNTPQGQITALKNTWGDFMEGIGGFISSLITPLVKGFNDWIDKMGGADGVLAMLQQKVQEFMPYIQGLGVAIGVGLVVALGALGVALLSNPITWFVAAVVGLGMVIGKIIEHFGGWDATMKKLQPVIDWFKGAWDKIVEVWNTYLLPALQMLYNEFQTKLLPALQAFWAQHGQKVIMVLQVLAVVIGVILVVAIGVIIASIYIMINVWTAVVNAVTWVISELQRQWQAGVDNWNMVVNMIKTGIDQFIAFFQNLPQNIGFIIGSVIRWFMELPTNAANMVNQIINWFSQLPGRAQAFFSNLVNTIANWLNQLPGRAQGAAQSLVNGFIGFIQGLPGMVGGIFNNVVNTVAGWAGSMFNKAREIAGKFWEGFKQGLGIHSPSYIEKAFMAIGTQSQDTLAQMSTDMNKLNNISFGNFNTLLGNQSGSGSVTNNSSAQNNKIDVTIMGNASAPEVQDGLLNGLRVAARGI